MASEKISFIEALAMAVDGMIDGGIFTVLGVIAVEASLAAWQFPISEKYGC